MLPNLPNRLPPLPPLPVNLLLPPRSACEGQLCLGGGAVLDHKGVDLPDGQRFSVCSGDFDDHGQIGMGSYSRVHKVFHKPTQMFMAIKKIQVQEDDTGLRQIMVELDVLRQSKSRYIVDFYGAFFCDAMVYFCMELIDGGSLDRLIPLGPFPTCVVGRIGCDVLEGLIYMKSAMGVIHRDIRPSNILVDRRGRIKLCDFGVSAKLVNSLASTYVGTQKYMSPERIDGGQPYGAQSDVWSLGISLMEMVTSSCPYPEWDAPGSSLFKRMLLITKTGPRPIRDLLQSGVDQDLCDLLGQCLRMVPEQRPMHATLRSHPFIERHAHTDISEWASQLIEKTLM